MYKKYNNEINADRLLKRKLKKPYIKYESGRIPHPVTLGQSDPKTRGSIMTQSGRSMVEMLGVLAVIGVLSIAGIMGYSYGMDKYRANQTVNDIMLRSVDLLNHLTHEKIPDLSDWQDEQTLYPMDVERNNSLGQYAIVVENVPSRVCKMIGDSLKGTADIYVGSETFDESDTTTDPCDESDENIMEFYFNTISCNPVCADDEYCEFGFCFKTDRIPHHPEYDCGYSGNSCLMDDETQGICTSKGCEPIGTCTSNADCTEKGEFCAAVVSDDVASCWSRFPYSKTGICTKETMRRFEFNNKAYYVAHPFMSWWNGEWFCDMLGKEMIGVNDWIKDFKDVAGKYELTDFANYVITNLGPYWVWSKDAKKGDEWKPWMLNRTGTEQQCKRNQYTVICK